MEARLSRYGVTPVQTHVLLYLFRHDGQAPQCQVTEFLKVKPSTANGILDRMVEKGLVDRVAMDIKNSPELYAHTVGLEQRGPGPIERSKDFLLSGSVDYEFRTTLVRELHRPEDLDAIAAWLAGAPRYYLQNFVDSGNLIGRGYHGFTAEQAAGLCGAGPAVLWSCGAARH